jgi:hypothetical protein
MMCFGQLQDGQGAGGVFGTITGVVFRSNGVVTALQKMCSYLELTQALADASAPHAARQAVRPVHAFITRV